MLKNLTSKKSYYFIIRNKEILDIKDNSFFFRESDSVLNGYKFDNLEQTKTVIKKHKLIDVEIVEMLQIIEIKQIKKGD